MFEQLRAAF